MPHGGIQYSTEITHGANWTCQNLDSWWYLSTHTSPSSFVQTIPLAKAGYGESTAENSVADLLGQLRRRMLYVNHSCIKDPLIESCENITEDAIYIAKYNEKTKKV